MKQWLEQHALKMFIIFAIGTALFVTWVWLKSPPSRDGEPLVGNWIARVGPKQCVIAFNYKRDGGVYITNRNRTIVERFHTREWEENPLLWEYNGTVESDHGGEDCFGSTTTTVDKKYNYLVRFAPGYQSAEFCTLDLKQCDFKLTRMD